MKEFSFCQGQLFLHWFHYVAERSWVISLLNSCFSHFIVAATITPENKFHCLCQISCTRPTQLENLICDWQHPLFMTGSSTYSNRHINYDGLSLESYIAGGLLTRLASIQEVHPPSYLLQICYHLYLGWRKESNYETKAIFYPLWKQLTKKTQPAESKAIFKICVTGVNPITGPNRSQGWKKRICKQRKGDQGMRFTEPSLHRG